MNRTQKSQCRQIAEKYGIPNQERQSVSEFVELLYVLTRRPGQRKPNWKDQLIDEICDAEIMIQQLKTMYDITDSEISDHIDYKLNRQLDRISLEDDVM